MNGDCGCGTNPPNEKYVCSKSKDKCPPKEVKKDDPAPECCGAPMTKQ